MVIKNQIFSYLFLFTILPNDFEFQFGSLPGICNLTHMCETQVTGGAMLPLILHLM